MILGDRIRERLEALEMSQARLARCVGVSPQAISKMVLGDTTNSPLVYQIAKALETSPEYLTGDIDDPTPTGLQSTRLAAVALPDEEGDDVELDSVDLAYGMGGTFLDAGDVEVEKVKFSRKWLRKFTDAPPERLGVAEGVGDSMEPTIYDRDLVIFDRSARLEDHLSDKIWVFAFGQMGMIKRLRPMPDGTVKIMSDNQSVRDELATDNDLHIIGRVVGSMRRH